MGRHTWTAGVGHLKQAVKKLNFVLSFNLSRWRVASLLCNPTRRPQRRLKSFNDSFGLHGCIEDGDNSVRNKMVIRSLQRATSYASDEDIDQRAEIFIANFRRQLMLERQISLQARCYRGNSFTRDY